MQVHDSGSCVASIQHSSCDTGGGVDCWIRARIEQWPGNDVDKLNNEVIGQSRWLREHIRPRKTVPRMRIGAFVDGCNNRYNVFVDGWGSSPKEVELTQWKCSGWTAFVYQLLDALQCFPWAVRFSASGFALRSLQLRREVTETTLTYSESAACASHAEIAQPPWRGHASGSQGLTEHNGRLWTNVTVWPQTLPCCLLVDSSFIKFVC